VCGVLSLLCGLDGAEWHAAPFGSVHVGGTGIALPDGERELPGPTLALIVWVRFHEKPNQPELGSTWISLLPTDRVDLDSSADLSRFDDWTMLCELLNEHASKQLSTFGFPERQGEIIRTFVADAEEMASAVRLATKRDSLISILRHLARLAADHADSARRVAGQLAAVPEDSELPETYIPRPISRELRRTLNTPPVTEQSGEAVVARVLADL
jgi:hypothetical protein